MKVRMKKTRADADRVLVPEQEVDLPKKLAEALIKAGDAVALSLTGKEKR